MCPYNTHRYRAQRRATFMRTLIHDLPETLAPFFPEGSSEGSVTLRADGRCAPCKGCFACWLKQPGFCSMPDAFQHAGALIGQSDRSSALAGIADGDGAGEDSGGTPAVFSAAGMREATSREKRRRVYMRVPS